MRNQARRISNGSELSTASARVDSSSRCRRAERVSVSGPQRAATVVSYVYRNGLSQHQHSVVAGELLLDLIAVDLAFGHEDQVATELGNHRTEQSAGRRRILLREEHVVKLLDHLTGAE